MEMRSHEYSNFGFGALEACIPTGPVCRGAVLGARRADVPADPPAAARAAEAAVATATAAATTAAVLARDRRYSRMRMLQ